MRERKIFAKKTTAPRKRVIIPKRSYEDWKQLITTCLTQYPHKRNPQWGCLNKQGQLFEILTLTHREVPADVFFRLREEGVITLDKETGFYQLVKLKTRRILRK